MDDSSDFYLTITTNQKKILTNDGPRILIDTSDIIQDCLMLTNDTSDIIELLKGALYC